MKIYDSYEYISEPKIGDLRLKVNSQWDFGSREVCFRTINDNLVGYDLIEAIKVENGTVVGSDKPCKRVQWRQAKITEEIVEQLRVDGYSVSLIR